MGYYGYRKIRHDFEITKREVLFSIAIIAVMTLIGFVIHGKISDNLMNEYQKYNTALQIDNNSEMFSYGMRTDIGNAFVHGDLKAVDTVTYLKSVERICMLKKSKKNTQCIPEQ